MKSTSPFSFCISVCAFALGFCAVATAKDAPLRQRGWIGGEFKVVTVFPAGFSNAPKAAVLITALNTNTPASLAGLEPGDLILEVNHQPATQLRGVRRAIDKTRAGTMLPVKVWHEGEIAERNICVGREMYQQGGIFMMGLPGFAYAPKLWPFTLRSAGLSVIVAGFKPESSSDRKELSSAEAIYLKSCNPKNFEVTEEGWKAWLVIMQAETRKRVKSQEIVPSDTAAVSKGDQQTFGYLYR